MGRHATPPTDELAFMTEATAVTSPVSVLLQHPVQHAVAPRIVPPQPTDRPRSPSMATLIVEDTKVPSRFTPTRRSSPRQRSRRAWPRRVRVFVAAAATALVITSGLPAYAADPTQVTLLDPTTLVAITTDIPQQTYAVNHGASADLERSSVVLNSTPSAAPDTQTLTAACAIGGADYSGGVVYPVPNHAYHLTSGLGYRYIASLGRADYHTGQDFAAPLGTSIFAIVDGTVTEVGLTGGATFIKVHSALSTGEVVDTYYVHEFPDGVFVKVGDVVNAGQKIAQVGNSGITTGSHLHLEMHDVRTTLVSEPAQRDNLIDPIPWLTAHSGVSVGSC